MPRARTTALPRYLEPNVRSDLEDKMVFLGGPRQVGKTTLAQRLLGAAGLRRGAYFNWDVAEDRARVLKGELPPNQRLWVFDEIHKYARWRNFVKGLYDGHKTKTSILVTGSARLDLYRRGGDSLVGRYHYLRLHPFSLRELDRTASPGALAALLRYGGFPEPLFAADDTRHRRWQREHRDRVLREDLRDLERVKEVSLVEELAAHLPDCVGSPLSIASLSGLLQVAHATVERWVTMLERLYVAFRIPPFGSKRIRAVKKEQKLYFWDWSVVPSDGARFENLVACQLLKYCHFKEDTEGHRTSLRFLRDTDKREVDFVVLRDEKPEFAVECRTGERGASPAARYFKERTAIGRFYQVHQGERDYVDATSGTRVLPFRVFCGELGMP